MEAGDDDATRRKVVERHLAKVRSLYPLPKKVSVESPNGGASGEYTLDRDQKNILAVIQKAYYIMMKNSA